MPLSIGVDHSTVPPTLRINGRPLRLEFVRLWPDTQERKEIRRKLSGMTNGKKLVAYTMQGVVLPKPSK